jgi:ribosomal protein S4
MVYMNNKRPQLKVLVKYKIYLSVRLLNNKKLIKQKKCYFGSVIKQKTMENIRKKNSGWVYLKNKLSRNNIFVLSTNNLSINKKYKMYLLSKQKFKNAFFISNNFMRSLFKYKTLLQKLYCRIDFLVFRIFPFSTLFFIRKLIYHRCIKIKCINKYIVKINYIVQCENLIVITKHIYYPKIQSYNKKIKIFNHFNYSNTFLLFGMDINYKIQSFILNLDFLRYFEVFSIFYGFLFSINTIKNFYNR